MMGDNGYRTLKKLKACRIIIDEHLTPQVTPTPPRKIRLRFCDLNTYKVQLNTYEVH